MRRRTPGPHSVVVGVDETTVPNSSTIPVNTWTRVSATVDHTIRSCIRSVGMPTPNPSSQRPLVLLDVDGVINDLKCLWGDVPDDRFVLRSNGFSVFVPDYMPALVQWLCSVAEVHWCTTWRHRANSEIARHLGIGPLPVVDDGTNDRRVDWKAAAAFSLVEQALDAGRRVVWIEDFYGRPPVKHMPAGVEFVDTARDDDPLQVLTIDMVPEWMFGLSSDKAA